MEKSKMVNRAIRSLLFTPGNHQEKVKKVFDKANIEKTEIDLHVNPHAHH